MSNRVAGAPETLLPIAAIFEFLGGSAVQESVNCET
jgi:hypothetical protein